MFFTDSFSLDSRLSSYFKSVIETFKSEQFSQNFERFTYSTTGDRFFVLEKSLIHVYYVAWTGGSKYTCKVKSISHKFSFALSEKPTLFDVDYSDQKLIIVNEKSKTGLHFYNSKEGESEGITKLDQSVFYVETFAPIVDFYTAKDDFLAPFGASGFILVQTTEAFLILSDNNSKFPRKIFSLYGDFSDTFRCKYQFFIEKRSNHSQLNGIFSTLNQENYTQYLVTNFENGKQTVVVKSSTSVLDVNVYERILAFDVSSLDHITAIFYTADCVIAKYILSMNAEPFCILKAKDIMLTTKHVCSKFYIYNESCDYVYGKISPELEDFDGYRKLTKSNFGFQTLKIDAKEQLEGNYWTLLNETQFIVVSLESLIVKNYIIDKENGVTIKNQMSIPKINKISQNEHTLIKFLRNGKTKIAFMVETNDSLVAFEIKFAMREIESVSSVFTIEKSTFFGSNKILFFQFILQKTPNKIYKSYTLVNNRKLVAIDFDLDKKSLVISKNLELELDILELYKCKYFPYNVLLLSKSETLIVLNSNLQVQTTFELSKIRPYLQPQFQHLPFLGNFNLKHLYDRFYIVI